MNETKKQSNLDYRELYERLLALPNCNTCAIRSTCKLTVEPGQVIRINCPLWIKKTDKT